MRWASSNQRRAANSSGRMSRVPFGAAISGIGVRVYGLAAAAPCEGWASVEPFVKPPGVHGVCKGECWDEVWREVMHSYERAIAALSQGSRTGPVSPSQRGNRHQDRRATPDSNQKAAPECRDHEWVAVGSFDSQHQ